MAQPQPGSQPALLPRVGGVQLTQRVLETLVRAINAGSFPGGRLPPENELAEQLGVSRTTLRRALQSLEQLGLIERRPGRGTKVRRYARPDMFALHGLVPFPALLRELGYNVESHISFTRLEPAPEALSVRLLRRLDGAAYRVETVLTADGEPAVAMTEEYPEDNLSVPLTDDLVGSGSILIVSESCFIEKIDHAVATLEPTTADGHGEQALSLTAGHAFLSLDETFYTAEEIPVAISRVAVNPRCITFSVFRRFL